MSEAVDWGPLSIHLELGIDPSWVAQMVDGREWALPERSDFGGAGDPITIATSEDTFESHEDG